MVKSIVFVVLFFFAALCTLALLINGGILIVKTLRHTETATVLRRIKHLAVTDVALLGCCVGLVWFSQATAHTPAILDAHGKEMEGSVAELISIDLNGRKEWISIRGQSTEAPVLLFLAGGPGGTQMAAVRHELGALEAHFIVVGWDQAGSGKSYAATAVSAITPETYVDDGIALTQYLCERFAQEKIYLIGESWGSALGIFMLDARPDLFHGMIGTGQMVAFEETERTDYQAAMALAREAGDTRLVAQLENNGEPPYYGTDVTRKSAAYLNYLSSAMAQNPQVRNGGYNTFRDLFSAEYGIWDQINFFRGITGTFGHVYPQLYSIDLRKDYVRIDVPVYFFIGRHDLNAPVSLADAYYDALQAPEKELVWFEHSAHSPWINEADAFVRETIRVFQ